VSEVNQDLLATLGELTDELVEQTGPTGDFVYIDISSIDRETKRISDPKPLTLSQAPSRAKQVLKAGDILVSMTRPNLNAVALVPDQLDGAIGSTGFHVLRSRWLNPGFLLALVQTQSFVDAMSAVVQGALYPAVRPRDIFYAQGVKANVVFFDNAPKDGRLHTKGVWFYDLRTNRHFTLKTRQLKLDDLQDFIACYNPENRHERKENQCFKYFTYDALMARDKASLDIFWLKDDSLDNLDDLPSPDVLQQEIIEHLEAALLAFRDVAASLPKSIAITP